MKDAPQREEHHDELAEAVVKRTRQLGIIIK